MAFLILSLKLPLRSTLKLECHVHFLKIKMCVTASRYLIVLGCLNIQNIFEIFPIYGFKFQNVSVFLVEVYFGC